MEPAPGRFSDPKMLFTLQRWTVQAIFHCLETELSVAGTFIQVARGWYQLGNRSAAEKAAAEVIKAIQIVYQRAEMSFFFDQVSRDSFKQRCQILEQELLALGPGHVKTDRELGAPGGI